MMLGAPMAKGAMADRFEAGQAMDAAGAPPAEAPPGQEQVQPTVRSQFADTAYWAASILTDREGQAEIALNMPENLTGWKVRAWSLGAGTRVGQGEAEVVTKKNLLVRLQAPRFFVEKDEVVTVLLK